MPFNINKEIDRTNLILDLIGVRQKAVSSNIANVNTPGYVRQEVSFEGYLDSLDRPLETKLSKKMGPGPIMTERGEKVNIAEEFLAMQKNSLFYSIASRRATMLFQEMKTASNLGR